MDANPEAVLVFMSVEEAETLSLGLSDLLCWCAGFNAAIGPDESDRRPMGVNSARDINIRLKSAMDKAYRARSAP